IPGRLALPEHLSGRALDGEAEELAVAKAGQVNAIAVDNRRRVTLRQVGLPDDVSSRAEICRQAADLSHSRPVRPAETRPLVGGPGSHHEPRHQDDENRTHGSHGCSSLGARLPAPVYSVSGSGASGSGQTIFVNCPRCSSSRPFPPRPVTSYFAVLMVCSAPRLVSTVIRSRSPDEAMNPRTRSVSDDSLMRMTPRPGPDRKFTSSTFVRMARASRVAAISTSLPVAFATPTHSAPSAALAKRLPLRVLGSTNGSRPNRML